MAKVRAAQIPIVCTEYNLPTEGWYLATRRKDGAYYVRLNLNVGPTRKWVRPSKVNFKEKMSEVLVDKSTDLET